MQQHYITLSEATQIVRQITGGKQVSSTIWRWTTGRHHGSRLKVIYFGEVAYTTPDWIRDFLQDKSRRKSPLDPEPGPAEPPAFGSPALIPLSEGVRYLARKRNRVVGRSTLWRWAFAPRRSGVPLRTTTRGREILTSRRWIDEYLAQSNLRQYRSA